MFSSVITIVHSWLQILTMNVKKHLIYSKSYEGHYFESIQSDSSHQLICQTKTGRRRNSNFSSQTVCAKVMLNVLFALFVACVMFICKLHWSSVNSMKRDCEDSRCAFFLNVKIFCYLMFFMNISFKDLGVNHGRQLKYNVQILRIRKGKSTKRIFRFGCVKFKILIWHIYVRFMWILCNTLLYRSWGLCFIVHISIRWSKKI